VWHRRKELGGVVTNREGYGRYRLEWGQYQEFSNKFKVPISYSHGDVKRAVSYASLELEKGFKLKM
jgi:hypothetical protein